MTCFRKRARASCGGILSIVVTLILLFWLIFFAIGPGVVNVWSEEVQVSALFDGAGNCEDDPLALCNIQEFEVGNVDYEIAFLEQDLKIYQRYKKIFSRLGDEELYLCVCNLVRKIEGALEVARFIEAGEIDQGLRLGYLLREIEAQKKELGEAS